LRERAQATATCFAQGSTTHARQDHTETRPQHHRDLTASTATKLPNSATRMHILWVQGMHGDGKCTFTTISVEGNSVADGTPAAPPPALCSSAWHGWAKMIVLFQLFSMSHRVRRGGLAGVLRRFWVVPNPKIGFRPLDKSLTGELILPAPTGIWPETKIEIYHPDCKRFIIQTVGAGKIGSPPVRDLSYIESP
jgi:hypothetical protein